MQNEVEVDFFFIHSSAYLLFWYDYLCLLLMYICLSAFYVPETLVNHFHFVPAKYRARGVFWWRMVQME